MEIILRKDVPNVGRMGELVKVRNGYARNFLLPRELAVVANRGNRKSLEHHRRLIDLAKKKVVAESETKASDVQKIKLKVSKRFNEAGKMFGSVTSTELVDLLKSKGIEADRRDLEFDEIKEAGSYEIKLRLPGDVYSSFSLEVKAVQDEKAKSKKKLAKSPKTEAPETEASKSEKDTDETPTES